MRYRKLNVNNDYLFGGGSANFYINQPEAVGQAVLTRLELQLGEWFLDPLDGTPWNTQVLGHNTAGTRDLIIQERTLGTQGLSTINQFYSFTDPNTRTYSAQETVTTIYGAAFINTTPTPNVPVPPLPSIQSVLNKMILNYSKLS